MALITAGGLAIQKTLDANGLTCAAWCRMHGLDRWTVARIASGETSTRITVNAAHAIAKAILGPNATASAVNALVVQFRSQRGT